MLNNRLKCCKWWKIHLDNFDSLNKNKSITLNNCTATLQIVYLEYQTNTFTRLIVCVCCIKQMIAKIYLFFMICVSLDVNYVICLVLSVMDLSDRHFDSLDSNITDRLKKRDWTNTKKESVVSKVFARLSDIKSHYKYISLSLTVDKTIHSCGS